MDKELKRGNGYDICSEVLHQKPDELNAAMEAEGGMTNAGLSDQEREDSGIQGG